MQNLIINELLNKTLTARDFMNLSKQIPDDKVLLMALQNHPNIDFESVEVSGCRLKHRGQ